MDNPSDTPCRQTTHRLHLNSNRLNVAKLPETQQEMCDFNLTCAENRIYYRWGPATEKKRRSTRKLKLNNSQLRSRPSHRDVNVDGVLPWRTAAQITKRKLI